MQLSFFLLPLPGPSTRPVCLRLRSARLVRPGCVVRADSPIRNSRGKNAHVSKSPGATCVLSFSTRQCAALSWRSHTPDQVGERASDDLPACHHPPPSRAICACCQPLIHPNTLLAIAHPFCRRLVLTRPAGATASSAYPATATSASSPASEPPAPTASSSRSPPTSW